MNFDDLNKIFRDMQKKQFEDVNKAMKDILSGIQVSPFAHQQQALDVAQKLLNSINGPRLLAQNSLEGIFEKIKRDQNETIQRLLHNLNEATTLKPLSFPLVRPTSQHIASQPAPPVENPAGDVILEINKKVEVLKETGEDLITVCYGKEGYFILNGGSNPDAYNLHLTGFDIKGNKYDITVRYDEYEFVPMTLSQFVEKHRDEIYDRVIEEWEQPEEPEDPEGSQGYVN